MSRSFKHFEWPDNYYIWLCDLIDLETHKGYSKLISFLYDTEFTWSVRVDSNMAQHGRDLRQHYIFECPDDNGEWLDDPCSWLEMLVALAGRIRVDIMPDYDIDLDEWLWQFIELWGLNQYDNRHFSSSEVFEILGCKKGCKIQNFDLGVKNFSNSNISDLGIWHKIQFWLAKKYDF